MTKSPSERQASFRKRQHDKGLVFFQAWIPRKKLRELREFVKGLWGGKDVT